MSVLAVIAGGLAINTTCPSPAAPCANPCLPTRAPSPSPPTPQDLAHTLRTRLAGQPRFGAPRRSQHAFVVDHYAGEVCYSAQHLMDKNKVRGEGCSHVCHFGSCHGSSYSLA